MNITQRVLLLRLIVRVAVNLTNSSNVIEDNRTLDWVKVCVFKWVVWMKWVYISYQSKNYILLALIWVYKCCGHRSLCLSRVYSVSVDFTNDARFGLSVSVEFTNDVRFGLSVSVEFTIDACFGLSASVEFTNDARFGLSVSVEFTNDARAVLRITAERGTFHSLTQWRQILGNAAGSLTRWTLTRLQVKRGIP